MINESKRPVNGFAKGRAIGKAYGSYKEWIMAIA